MVLDNSYFLTYTHFHKYINYFIGSKVLKTLCSQSTKGEVSMQIVAIVVQVLVGIGFLLAGGPKLVNMKQSLQQRDHLGIVPWFWRLTGGLEILGAIALFVGIWYPLFAVAGGLLLAATMVGAFFTLVMRKDSFSHMLPVIVLFVLIAFLLVVRLPQMMGGSL
jgi:uncharacterized membrane protein YphA (DoxX/SURF4 family)